MTIRLCVLLWARPGAGDAMAAYEDTVLALLAEHGGRVLQRARTLPGAPAGAPDETQLIAFADQAGYDGFLADPRRAALAADRDAAIARTELYPVTLL
ncbi:DUF1330 domain-containing protein [Actinoplanes xinjiangensis]|uniref:DUF1330 domain-containing protein n=1 Tax=Actinoplanes xinjiangensis TaxID=512350 RepID=UPI00342E62F7